MGASERRWRNPGKETMEARAWVERQPLRTKVSMGAVVAAAVLLLLWIFVDDHDYIFIASDVSHAAGISVLIYKLFKDRNCAGLSLKSQELTALFLTLRIYCNYLMKFDIHSILDIATLITTLWVIYMIRIELKSSYMEDEDNYSMQYLHALFWHSLSIQKPAVLSTVLSSLLGAIWKLSQFCHNFA